MTWTKDAENSRSEYWRNDGRVPVTVIRTKDAQGEPIWCCLTCVKNRCEHIRSIAQQVGS